MRIVKRILLVLLTLIVVGVIGLSIFVGQEVFAGFSNATLREETLENERKYYLEEFNLLVENFKLEELSIPSSKFNHNIPALFIQEDGNEAMVLLVHGMGATKKSLVKEMEFFLSNGFNVVSIDQRNSGENLANTNTFGYLESYDILDAIDYIRNNINHSGDLVLYGESYGGLSAIIAAGRDDTQIDYLILDCPVSDGELMMTDILLDIEEQQGIPSSYMMFTGNLYTQFKLGFRFEDTNGNDWIKAIEVPILVLNSKVDIVTPYQMGLDLYNSIKHDKKMMVTSEFATHAQLLQEDPQRYSNGIKDFLGK